MDWIAIFIGLAIGIEARPLDELERRSLRLLVLAVLIVEAAVSAHGWREGVRMVAMPIGLYKIASIAGGYLRWWWLVWKDQPSGSKPTR